MNYISTEDCTPVEDQTYEYAEQTAERVAYLLIGGRDAKRVMEIMQKP